MTRDFIGRVTTAGAVTLFPVSSFGPKSPVDVDSLAAGADGNLWFTEGLAKHTFSAGCPRAAS